MSLIQGQGEGFMNHSQSKFNISLSQETYNMIKQTKKGTNLSDSDVVELIIQQYFRYIEPSEKSQVA